MSQKIVVVGDVAGELSGIFGRLKTLQAKQNFSFCIIAGDLFRDPAEPSLTANEDLEKLLRGEIEVPLPTYFTLGKHTLPVRAVEVLEQNDGELAPNLTALGRRTRVKTSEGTTILSISGAHKEFHLEDLPPWESEYVDKDVFQAISFHEADILITSDWPTDVKAGSSIICAGPASKVEAPSLAKLCSEIKPRYHFSTSQAFYEREPFYHDADSPGQITRFIALAPYGNAQKEKSIYAFNLDPSTVTNIADQPPPGTTASPFQARKRKLDSQQAAFNEFRFAKGDSNEARPQRGKRRKYAPAAQPRECYFCLSNPACETHMVGSIGTDAYVTVAKGPLTTRTTFPDLGFPGHLLIIPLVHVPTLSSIPDDEARSATMSEMAHYQRALHKMVTSKPELGSVTWEISRGGGVHDHWQFLPMPLRLLGNGAVEAAFKAKADELDYPAFRDEEPEVSEIEKSDHFKLMLWSGEAPKVMVMPLDQSFRFDLQFARRVLGKLLGLAERGDWKDCGQSKSEEEADVLALKEMFKEFDFSL